MRTLTLFLFFCIIILLACDHKKVTKRGVVNDTIPKNKYEPLNPTTSLLDTLLEDSLNLTFKVFQNDEDYLKYSFGNNSEDFLLFRNKIATVLLKKGDVVFSDTISKKNFINYIGKEEYSQVFLLEAVFKSYDVRTKELVFEYYLNVPDTDVRYVYEYSINKNLDSSIKQIE